MLFGMEAASLLATVVFPAPYAPFIITIMVTHPFYTGCETAEYNAIAAAR
jgi:hypothetical protein